MIAEVIQRVGDDLRELFRRVVFNLVSAGSSPMAVEGTGPRYCSRRDQQVGFVVNTKRTSVLREQAARGPRFAQETSESFRISVGSAEVDYDYSLIQANGEATVQTQGSWKRAGSDIVVALAPCTSRIPCRASFGPRDGRRRADIGS